MAAAASIGGGAPFKGECAVDRDGCPSSARARALPTDDTGMRLSERVGLDCLFTPSDWLGEPEVNSIGFPSGIPSPPLKD